MRFGTSSTASGIISTSPGPMGPIRRRFLDFEWAFEFDRS